MYLRQMPLGSVQLRNTGPHNQLVSNTCQAVAAYLRKQIITDNEHEIN